MLPAVINNDDVDELYSVLCTTLYSLPKDCTSECRACAVDMPRYAEDTSLTSHHGRPSSRGYYYDEDDDYYHASEKERYHPHYYDDELPSPRRPEIRSEDEDEEDEEEEEEDEYVIHIPRDRRKVSERSRSRRRHHHPRPSPSPPPPLLRRQSSLDSMFDRMNVSSSSRRHNHDQDHHRDRHRHHGHHHSDIPRITIVPFAPALREQQQQQRESSPPPIDLLDEYDSYDDIESIADPEPDDHHHPYYTRREQYRDYFDHHDRAAGKQLVRHDRYYRDHLGQLEEEVQRDDQRPYPRRGMTRFPRRIVHVRAIMELGYPFQEEVCGTYVSHFLVVS